MTSLSLNQYLGLSIGIGTLGVASLCIIAIRRSIAGPLCKSTARLVGKTVIITGANTGIGKSTALELAKRKARVILACRNINKGNQAAKDIIKAVPYANLSVKQLDLASLNNIKQFANEIDQNESEVNILINNAGIAYCPYQQTEDGFEMQMGVNHLGHFYLTNLLLAKLKSSPDSRILILSSILSKYGKIDVENICVSQNKYDKKKAYSNSKLANNLFCRQLSKKLAGTDVQVYAISPGFVATDLGRHTPLWIRILGAPLGWLFRKTATDGCQTVVYCAVSPGLDNEQYSGKFFRNCQMKEWDAASLDDETAEKLWNASLALVKLE